MWYALRIFKVSITILGIALGISAYILSINEEDYKNCWAAPGDFFPVRLASRQQMEGEF